MIDLHNHVLPGVDDGAEGIRTSMRMLEQAILQGITHVCGTPHVTDRCGHDTDRLFRSVFDELKAAIVARELPVEIGFGSEIMFGPDLQTALNCEFATFNGKGEYFLVEFPIETPFEIILNVIRASRRWGKRPVLAHFERFVRAHRTDEQPAQLRTEGAVLTLDAGSLFGQFGRPMQTASRRLLKLGVIDVLASDAHNAENHGFCLKRGFEIAAELIGETKAMPLVVDNPRRIWDGSAWDSDKHQDAQSRE